MKYLRKFNDHSEYVPFTQSNEFIRPNVSYCVQEDEVHYSPYTFADEYFTTVARENGTISFNIWKSVGTDMITSISYSTDNGETWATTQNQNNKSAHLSIDVNVEEGDKVMWKGNATQLGYDDENEYGDIVGSFFSSTCEFDAQGNIMSLLYGDDFKNKTTIEKDYAFALLFFDYNREKICEVVNAKNLSLPATTLAQQCYASMFQGCTSLITAPELPAETLASYCYANMFRACTSLTVAPELPATTLTKGCYGSMFKDCTSLITAPVLPATTLVSNCYENMFSGCTSLNYIKAMFTTTPSGKSPNYYTTKWVDGVAASGTFVKNSAAQWDVTGVHGIPKGWTVETATE